MEENECGIKIGEKTTNNLHNAGDSILFSIGSPSAGDKSQGTQRKMGLKLYIKTKLGAIT